MKLFFFFFKGIFRSFLESSKGKECLKFYVALLETKITSESIQEYLCSVEKLKGSEPANLCVLQNINLE